MNFLLPRIKFSIKTNKFLDRGVEMLCINRVFMSSMTPESYININLQMIYL